MGVSKDRKRQHRKDLIGEKRTYNNPGIDYTTLPDDPKPQRNKLKQNLPEDSKLNHKLSRFIPECREKLPVVNSY